jgi:YgiT-type zinc finger domain-containing protein
MICVVCRQADTMDGLTQVAFARGEFRLLIKSVPARVCPGCGESYVEEEVAVQLLQSAEEVYHEGNSDAHTEYITG